MFYMSCSSCPESWHLLFGTEGPAMISPESFISFFGFFLLPQSSNWSRMVFCFLNCSNPEMKLGTLQLGRIVFSHTLFPLHLGFARIRSPCMVWSREQLHLMHFLVYIVWFIWLWRVLESTACPVSLHGYGPSLASAHASPEDRNCWSSWTKLTSFDLNLSHVICLPWKIYGLDRDSSASCWTTVTRENPGTQHGERILPVWLWNPPCSQLSERDPLCSYRTTTDLCL